MGERSCAELNTLKYVQHKKEPADNRLFFCIVITHIQFFEIIYGYRSTALL